MSAPQNNAVEAAEKRLAKTIRASASRKPYGGGRKTYVNNSIKVEKKIEREKEIVQKVQHENKLFKQELKRLKGALKNMNNAVQVQSSACSGVDDFVSTGENSYLRSLLVPRDGAASVPDDVMRMHIIRSETITNNISMTPLDNTQTSVSGIILLYPNHPTSLIGYVFMPKTSALVPTDTISMAYAQKLVVAQNLSEAYDYGRRVSCELTARSSTLPSGMYAINGTFNAVRVEGSVSELELSSDANQTYSQLLSTTTNLYDKVGNVSVGDGVTVLGLPDSFVNPYVRLNDSTPILFAVGGLNNDSPGGATTNALYDDSQNLSQFLNCNCVLTPLIDSLGDSPCLDVNFNMDATIGVDYSVEGIIVTPLATAQYYPIQCQVIVNFSDPFGNNVAQYTHIFVVNTLPGVDNAWAINGRVLLDDLDYDPLINDNSAGPIASAGVEISYATSETPITLIGATASLKFESILGTRPGVITPVTVLAFQNVAANSVITISGVANYELIPNPDLRRNLETKYAHYSPQELEYAKQVISNRIAYDIRSVYAGPDYKQMIEHYRDLAACRAPKLESAALSWKNVLDFGKKLIKPLGNAAKVLVPESEPLIDFIQSKAAGGIPIMSRAASGNPITFRAYASTSQGEPLEDLNDDDVKHMSYEEFVALLDELAEFITYDDCLESVKSAVQRDVFKGDDLLFTAHAAIRRKKTIVSQSLTNVLKRRQAAKIRAKVKAAKSVCFPTLTCLSSGSWSVVEGEGLYGIFPGCRKEDAIKVYKVQDMPFTPTLGLGKIYGWSNPKDYVFPLCLKDDVTFLPLNPNSLNPILDSQKVAWPFVTDHSCDGALWIFSQLQFEGDFPLAVTGELNLDHGIPLLMPNKASAIKMQDLHSHGRMLMANDKAADCFVNNLRELVSFDISLWRKKAAAFRSVAASKILAIK